MPPKKAPAKGGKEEKVSYNTIIMIIPILFIKG